jgi:hypothetical protein
MSRADNLGGFKSATLPVRFPKELRPPRLFPNQPMTGCGGVRKTVPLEEGFMSLFFLAFQTGGEDERRNLTNGTSTSTVSYFEKNRKTKPRKNNDKNRHSRNTVSAGRPSKK